MHESIISAKSLRDLLSQKPVILDCRYSLQDPRLGETLYTESHIPSAFYCNLDKHLSSPRTITGGRHPLPSPAQAAATFASWGIHRFSHVVVYDDNRMGFAARAWFMLTALGVSHVQILNGGFSAWKQAGFALDKRRPQAHRGTLTASGGWPGVIDYDALSHEINNLDYCLIDSRETERYLGLKEPIDPVAGHIPGALNQPWQNITDDQGFVRPLAEQQSLWQPLLAHAGGDKPIVYCGSGVTACVNLLSLHLCGISTARLYGGSWSDWCARPQAEIEAGTESSTSDLQA